MDAGTLPVSFSMCDSSARLSLMSALRLVQDAASDEMRRLGIDELTLIRRHNAIWVLRRNVLRFGAFPAWQTPVRITSGLSLVSPVKIWMDTEVLLSDCTPVVSSRQELCAIGLDSFAIRKTGSIGVSPDLPLRPQIPDLAYTKFACENLAEADQQAVRCLQIDACGHGNNVELLGLVFGAYPARAFRERRPARLEIRYLSQAFEGDPVSVLLSGSGPADAFALESGDRRILEGLLAWAPQDPKA